MPVELGSGPCSPDKRATPHSYLTATGVCIYFVLPEQQGYDGEQHQRCAPTESWHHDLRLIDCEEHLKNKYICRYTRLMRQSEL